MSRICTEYVPQKGNPKFGRCHYGSPPTEYHRYTTLQHRHPNQDLALDFAMQVLIICDTKANYGGGTQTFTMGMNVFDNFGQFVSSSTTGQRRKNDTFEYDTTGGGVTPGNVQIDISGDTTAADVAATTAAAIRGAWGNGLTKANFNNLLNSSDTCQVITNGPKIFLTAADVDLPGAAGIQLLASRNFDVFPTLGAKCVPYYFGETLAAGVATREGMCAYYDPNWS